MKLLLPQAPRQRPGHACPPENEALRLALEIFADEGDLPAIDVPRARLRHWNGRQIAVPRSDLADLIERNLLAGNGRWTAHGRRHLGCAFGT